MDINIRSLTPWLDPRLAVLEAEVAAQKAELARLRKALGETN